ncbi:hypothetical protein BDZ45DRAFT_372632 [Acephala macrosclerotiorum]|nr:hypothetical protein BDZ45DRAFT_372632 [Acephala macrosclerotiorum]
MSNPSFYLFGSSPSTSFCFSCFVCSRTVHIRQLTAFNSLPACQSFGPKTTIKMSRTTRSYRRKLRRRRQCSQCSWKGCDLKAHYDSKHPTSGSKLSYKRKPLSRRQCSQCSWKGFDLKVHYDSKHPMCILHWCPKCNTPFSRAFDLKRHERELHGPVLRCDICDWTTKRQARLDSHLSKKH